MSSVNKVILVGNLGADPEARDAGSGRVVNLRVATSERYTGKDGEKREQTEWHTVTIWNERIGEFAERYLHKGDQVYIEGKSKTRKWQDQNGNDRYSTEVVIERFSGVLEKLGGSGQGGDDRDERGDRSRGNDNQSRRDGGRSSNYRDGGNARGDDRGRDDRRSSQSVGKFDRDGGVRMEDLDDDVPF